MAQLTIYLDDEAHRLVQEAAQNEGTSLSKWARQRLVKAAEPEKWPDGFFDLFGSITNDSFVEPDELDPALDKKRESF